MVCFGVDIVFGQIIRPARNDTHQIVELFLDRFQIVKDIGVIELQGC